MENVKQEPDWTKVAEIQLVYKSKVKNVDRPKVLCPEDASKLLLAKWNLDLIDLQEEFKLILLNRASRVLGIVHLSSGGKSGTIADIGLILAAAIKGGSSSIIISHNHPSGNLKPSDTDLQLTQKLKMAASYHDIKLADHIIMTSDGYYSMADEGVI